MLRFKKLFLLFFFGQQICLQSIYVLFFFWFFSCCGCSFVVERKSFEHPWAPYITASSFFYSWNVLLQASEQTIPIRNTNNSQNLTQYTQFCLISTMKIPNASYRSAPNHTYNPFSLISNSSFVITATFTWL